MSLKQRIDKLEERAGETEADEIDLILTQDELDALSDEEKANLKGSHVLYLVGRGRYDDWLPLSQEERREKHRRNLRTPLRERDFIIVRDVLSRQERGAK